jgi:hypothetical protein
MSWMISVPPPPHPLFLLSVLTPLLVSTVESFGYKFGYFAAFDFGRCLNFMEKPKTLSLAAGYT